MDPKLVRDDYPMPPGSVAAGPAAKNELRFTLATLLPPLIGTLTDPAQAVRVVLGMWLDAWIAVHGRQHPDPAAFARTFVNDGRCGFFAGDLAIVLGRHRVRAYYAQSFPEVMRGGTDPVVAHWFVIVDGRFYDAECAPGVDLGRELLLFKDVLAEHLKPTAPTGQQHLARLLREQLDALTPAAPPP